MKKRLRELREVDRYMLFNWRNHPDTRKNSFDKRILSLDDHNEWFDNILNSNSSFTYILEAEDIPVGAIRFDLKSTEAAEINYLIDPSKQGNGFGTQILDLGVKKIFKTKAELKEVYGYVLEENLASIRIFEKLAFCKVSQNRSEIKFIKVK